MRYIIIGNGIAGVSACEEIRKRDASCEITIIDRETHPLYSKVLLPHYLHAKIPRERVFVKKDSWYFEHGIDWQRGVEVVKIDTTNKFVATSDDREHPYDKLLIAAGGEVKLIPDDKKGVCYFRTLDDADSIFIRRQEVLLMPIQDRKVVILGSGFISFEFLNIFKAAQFSTTVILRSGGFFTKIISAESQKVLLDHVAAQGIEIVSGADLEEVIGTKEIEAVKLTNGQTLPCAMLGVGIGIDLERELYANTGIELGRGIKANEFLETPVEDVYTAGDCAEFLDVGTGRLMMVANWMNANMQGRAVGKTMAGERTKFELVSSYATNVLGLEVVMVGDVSREGTVVKQIESEPGSALEIFERDDRTVGAVLIGDTKRRTEITNAIKSRAKL